jgi:hypothetical protein
MATKKVTQLATATSAAASDLIMIVDVDDPAMSPEGTNKQITKANLGIGGLLTQVSRTVSNAEVLTMLHSDTPITLVENIAGQIIVPVGITIVATAAGTAEPSNRNLSFGWNASASGTADNFVGIRSMMSGVTGVTQSQSVSPYANAWTTAYPGDAANKKLQAWSTVQFTGGWDMIIYTTYYTITV